MSTDANIPSIVEIQNTLYVAKNGDDDTGKRNDLTQPFLTIAGATLQAQAGDCVYIFAGIYNEGSSDISKSNVWYDYQDGTFVNCTFTCINDFNQPRNIKVTGLAVFNNLAVNFSVACIQQYNAGSTLYFRSKEVRSLTNCFNLLGGTYDVKYEYAIALNQYVATIRGNTSGIMIFDTVDAPSVAVPFYFINLNTDLVARKITTIGRLINTNQSAVFGGAIYFLNVFNTIAYTTIQEINNNSVNAGAGIFRANSGKHLLTIVSGIALNQGFGILFEGSSINLMSDSNISSFFSFGLYNQGNARTELTRSQIINNSNAVPTTIGSVMNFGGASIDISFCTIVQKATNGLPCVLSVSNNNVRIRSTKLVGTPSLSQSIRSTDGLPHNICVEGDVVGNLPTDPLLTNIVAGTNVIVSPNVQMNTQTFFN